MKATWYLAAFLAAGAVAMPPTAVAMQHMEHDDDDEDYDRNRVYFGVGPLYGIENFKLHHLSMSEPAAISDADPDVDQSYGAEARVGYRFHPHLAAELQGQYDGDFDVYADTRSPIGKPLAGSVRVISSTANLKVFMLRGPIQPYALGGLGILWADTDDEAAGADLPTGDVEFAGRGGLGVDFYLSPALAITAEGTYLAPTGSLARYGLAAITVGAQFHF
jgi:hypothetical protein